MQFSELLATNLIVIALLWFQTHQVTESFQCPSCNTTCKCVCNVSDKSVRCVHQKLEEIPTEEIPPDVFTLDLSNNRLDSLEGLANLTNLTHLTLTHNRISKWSPEWLEGLPSLQQLQLSQNRIEKPPAGLCSRLPSLQRLYLDNNEIAAGFPKDYANCTKLSRLTLSNNLFKTIDNSTLCALHARAAQLSLKLNRLPKSVTVQAGALSCLSTRLISLDIGQNSLTQADLEGLVGESNLSRLLTLVLKMSAGLQAVTKSLLSGLTALQVLSLDGSAELKVLAADAFLLTPKLTRLSLSRTKVANWSAGSLDRLSLLHELDLSNTSVTTIGGFNGSDANPLPQLVNSSSKLANLSLLGAQLSCDCSIYWLSQQLRVPAVAAKLLDAKRLTCARPPDALGRRLVEFAPANCDGQSPSGFFTTKVIIILSSTAGGLFVAVLTVLTVLVCRRRRRQLTAAASDMDDPLVASAARPFSDDASSSASRQPESGWICLELRRFVRQSRETMAHSQERHRTPIYNPEPESYLVQDPSV